MTFWLLLINVTVSCFSFNLDLSAAFDTVDHDILHTRLHSKYSISGIALEIFHSYLTNRSQFTLIEGWRSQSRELKCGVPQGSVLGPIMYVLYTAPLADILRLHEMQFHFYADDIQFYISFSANNDMELTNSITKIVHQQTKTKQRQDRTSLPILKVKSTTIYTPTSLWNWHNQALFTYRKYWRYLRYHHVNAFPCQQCLQICLLSSSHHFPHRK